MDPYKVLNVPESVTLEELKEAYRVMAFKTHPDTGGSDALFQIVTSSFKTIFKRLKLAQSDKQFDSLKREYNNTNTRVVKIAPTDDASKFSIDTFNKLFDQHSRPDVHKTSGYSSFLKSSFENMCDQPVKMSQFNEAFNDRTSGVKSKHLAKVFEPSSIAIGKGVENITELGVERVEDFSGENLSKKNLHFTDLLVAHSTTRIVDPSTVSQRPDYKKLEDVEIDRSKISYNMSAKDRLLYDESMRKKKLQEKKRLELQHSKDLEAIEHYNKIHQLMLQKSMKI